MPRNLQQKVMKRVELLRTRTSQGKKVQLKKSELDVLAGFDGEEIREKVQTADGHPVIENGKISAPAEKLAENFWKKIAYVFGQNEARGWVRATMRNLYGRTAVENKYKREGTFFVKHL
jgi:hypothetical protein